MEYLSLVVSEGQIKMDPGKVIGVTDWSIPKSWKELQGFLSFLNFYWHFIDYFTKIACPLNALASEKQPFKWTPRCQYVFKQLKAKITTALALCMSNNEDPFYIETDRSDIGIGAIDNYWHPIAFISHSFNNTEQNYVAADLEMAVILFAPKKWHQYLLDAKHLFTILMDHKNLEYFMKPQDLSYWQACWNQILQEYHYIIQHHLGKTNLADPLSWRPDFEKGVTNNTQIQILPSFNLSKSKESSSMEILPTRVNTQTMTI